MIIKGSKISSHFAKTTWKPTKKECKALDNHSFVRGIDRIDDIWPLLKKHCGDIPALESPHTAYAESYTYKELAIKIEQGADVFRSLGLKEGDVVALFAENSPRWLIADQSLMRVGAANAVRGASAPINELRYILDDCGAVGLIVQSEQLFEELDLNENQRKRLKFVFVIEGDTKGTFFGWDYLSQKVDKSEFKERAGKADVSKKSAVVSPIATILYTSGTTGEPKGVPLTHANLLHQMRSLACIANPSPGTPLLSILPIWHSYERSAEYYFFSCGCTQHYTTIKNLKQDLQRVRPIVMATVPRLWESIKVGFDEAVKKMPSQRQKLLKKALKNSSGYKIALRKIRQLMIVDVNFKEWLLALAEVIYRWPIHFIASYFLWPKILKQLCGGRLKFPINGGGAIAPHVDQFFEALGIELLVGYGLTETSPVLSCRRPWRNIRGSSGLPLPETELKIVDQEDYRLLNFNQKGLVLARGPQVMNGYLANEEATAKVLDPDGWFNTGDLGMLLPDGSLVLTGRAKDTIVLSNGENIEPAPLEEELLSSSLIEQVMIVGQDQKQLGALVVPNVEQMLLWAHQKGISLSENFEDWVGDSNLRQALKREINYLLLRRQGCRPDERISGVAFVEGFSIENGLLTQTLKQKRQQITERDSNAIALIYSS
ncbi:MULTISPECIES: AMP-binding protein [Prochlorococcus]|uniref:AMP-binding protein n=1 Tax=Prochlorococcus TaxID=1218 RepID=UPI0005339C44|nr:MULTISPECIES: AMP-binding protein [Prochlorococcus]KGG12998.1 Long-chain-fatty-acid--CoA ligase [Prochlorococcus sp. MIT 0601]